MHCRKTLAFAAQFREQGYQVDILHSKDTISGLRQHGSAWLPDRIYCMAASEYNGQQFQNQLETKLGLPVKLVANTQFLTGRFNPILQPQTGGRYVLENFYRTMRVHFDLLIAPESSPIGGQWNYDAQNRRPLPKGIQPTERIRFEPDAVTTQVMKEVADLDHGLGNVQGFDLAVTHQDAWLGFIDFLDHRLVEFSPDEDARSRHSDALFHSVLSPYLNIGLLEALSLVQLIEARFHDGQAPLQSVEAFIRQIIGWREFIYWQYWRQIPGLKSVNFWNYQLPLPNFFWDANTEMNCLHLVIERALNSGYTHHIERLMVVSNFCLLAGINPQQVNDWFTACYIDAYEWVMLPNVLGMGLFADGGVTATKPYIA